MTELLALAVEEFEWAPPQPYQLLGDIFRHLSNLLLHGSHTVIMVETTHVSLFRPHPIPNESAVRGNTEVWQEEAGKLLALHKMCGLENDYFIGIPCPYAFVLSPKQSFPPGEESFPALGPTEIDQLASAFSWQVPPDITNQSISFSEAKKNVRLIGALNVKKPSGGSHYKVEFPNSRPWILDSNYSDVPPQYIDELVPITGLPLNVIKYALKRGTMPPKACLLLGVAPCSVRSG